MPELSLRYYTKILKEDGHISVETPLIPIKYQIRKYEPKTRRRTYPQQEKYNRSVIYCQNVALNSWTARLHFEGEEMLSFTRKVLNHVLKTDPEGLKLLLQNMSLDQFLEAEE